MRQIAVLAGPGEDHEFSGWQLLAIGVAFGAQERRAGGRPAEAIGRAHDQIGEHDAAFVAAPDRLGDGVAIPDAVQQLAANRVEVEGVELRGQVLGGVAVAAFFAAGLDRPWARDRGVETLIERGLAALVAQDVAIDAQRIAIVAPRIGIAGGLPWVGRELADILLEAAANVGGGDLAGRRPRRLALAHAGQHPPHARDEAAVRH